MQPVRAGGSPVTAAMSSAEAFGAIARSCLAHYEGNRAGILAGEDPEYLHQGRVALRRLRAAISLYAPVLDRRARLGVRKDLRRLLRRFGPARDWDVFLAFTLAPAMAAAPGDRALADLRTRCERLRRRAADRARKAAGACPASSVNALLVRLAADRDAARRPAIRHAKAALAKCARRVRRRGRGLARLGPEQLHRLRLAVKRMRYALHYFAPLFGECRVKPMRGALESLQHALGGANDCAVAAGLLRKLRAGPRSILARRNAAKLAAHRKELRAAWKVFRGAGEAWE